MRGILRCEKRTRKENDLFKLKFQSSNDKQAKNLISIQYNIFSSAIVILFPPLFSSYSFTNSQSILPLLFFFFTPVFYISFFLLLFPFPFIICFYSIFCFLFFPLTFDDNFFLCHKMLLNFLTIFLLLKDNIKEERTCFSLSKFFLNLLELYFTRIMEKQTGFGQTIITLYLNNFPFINILSISNK